LVERLAYVTDALAMVDPLISGNHASD
jgi:hypothetical protein